MANTRISDLTASASNLASTDLAPVVQTVGVGPVKMTGAQIAAGLLSATTPIGSGPILSRGGSATLQLGAADAAAPVAQTLQVQGVVAGTSNTAGANFTIRGSQGTGTGAGGSIIFQVAPAGSSGTAQNAYATALTIDAAGSFTFASPPASGAMSFTLQTGNAGAANNNDLILFRANSGNQGYVGYTTSNGGTFGLFDSSAAGKLAVTTVGASVGSGDVFGWASTAGASVANLDTKLYRDAANTLALRNGTSAQTYRIYATADGSPGSNFQRLTLSAGVTANMAVVAADNGGTGVAMGLQFGAALTTGGGVTNIFNINTSGHLVWNTTNTYDIGLSGGNRPRNGYFAGSLYAVGGTFGGTALSYYVNGDVASASGGRWYFTASSSVTDPIDAGFSRGGASTLTLIGSASSYTIQFGGTTASFPALKRSTTTLQVRLADDTAFAQLTASSLLAAGSTGVVGYSTGAGGAVTQATSRTTGVTLNKGCGQITLVSAAGTTSWQSFTVSNTTVAATDTIIVNQDSGTDLYQIFVTNVAANSFQITFATTGGTTTEQPVFSFAVIKAVAA